MSRQIKISSAELNKIRTIDKRLVSYNIEMTEITGGTFWKAYTSQQIAGNEKFAVNGHLTDFTSMADLMQYYPPVNLYDDKVRERAKALGSAWIRVSGSWATKTYYDFEGTTNGKAPEGYYGVLTKEQWIGVLDFVKAVNGKLLISVSNCAGDHIGTGQLDLTQTKKIFDFSHEYGVDIDAAEFMNEPNMLEMSGAPHGYTASDYARDQDVFNGWVRENYPNCILVGPCTLGDGETGKLDMKSAGAGIGTMMHMCTAHDLMKGTKIPLDVFSYHYYNGVSERLASIVPEGHWEASEAHTDDYLAVASKNAEVYAKIRDRYIPGAQMWVTESGDAGGGGNTWASTFLDVFRTLNELGSFALVSDGIIFHNTLASSDYGFLQHGSFEPRPNYFAVLLWNTLMGTSVYDCSDQSLDDFHIYCHSRRDRKEGYAYLIINNSLAESIDVDLSKDAEVYTLSGNGDIRSKIMFLNGKPLLLSEYGELPDLKGRPQARGALRLPPASCTYIVV